MKGIYTKLVSHGITDLSSEENIRTLNLILDKQLLLQEEGGAEGEGRGGEREGSEGKEGEGRGGERGSSEGKEGEECDLDWVRTTRQIMLDIGEYMILCRSVAKIFEVTSQALCQLEAEIVVYL